MIFTEVLSSENYEIPSPPPKKLHKTHKSSPQKVIEQSLGKSLSNSNENVKKDGAFGPHIK